MQTVSLIIPAYNSGPYLDEAVQSVIAQTFTDWECIVVDDGSTEDLSRVDKMDPRVRLIRQKNSGISMARNRGIAESTGEFIAFLDHDDAFLPTKLARQVTAMAGDTTIGLCHTDFAVMDWQGNFDPVGCGTNTAADFLTMLQFGAPYPTTTMIRRSVLNLVGVFDPFLTPSEDQDLFIRIAKFFHVAYVPTCEALYRVHGRNTSKNYMVCYRTLHNLAVRHEIFARYRGEEAVLAAAAAMMPYRRRKVFGPQAYDAARHSLRAGKLGDFGLHMARAMCWSPGFTLAALARFLPQRFARRTDSPSQPPPSRLAEVLASCKMPTAAPAPSVPVEPRTLPNRPAPRVSVVIPAHNRPELLRLAVQSVVEQSFTDWECIVCDDGSTEDLGFIGGMDPRVRLLRQPNRGVSLARNHAMGECTGEFIAFLDDDDIWLPGKLDAQVAAMGKVPDVGLCYTDFRLIDSAGNPAGPGWSGPLPPFGGPFPSFTMIRRSLLPAAGIFDCFCVTGAEDPEYFERLRLLSRVARVPEELGLYRIGSGSTGRRYVMHRRCLQNIVEKYVISAQFRHDPSLLRAASGAMREYDKFLASNAYAAARASWRGRRPLVTAWHVLWALRINPLQTIGSLAKFPLQQLTRGLASPRPDTGS